jgi:hypothetical protein
MLRFRSVNTSLVELVPAQHFYQRLLQHVDFSFVRPLVAPCYSTIGRPSLDSIFFVKLLLFQYLEHITSDRKLVNLASLHVGIRAFLGPWSISLKKYLRAATPQQAASSTIALPLPSHLFWSLVLFCNGHVCHVM